MYGINLLFIDIKKIKQIEEIRNEKSVKSDESYESDDESRQAQFILKLGLIYGRLS